MRTSRTSLRFLSLSSTTRISSSGMLHRERECERRALTGLALDPDTPAVQLDELAREREAETGALVLLGVVRPDLAELFEHRVEIFRGNADAGIAHGDLDLAVQTLAAHLHAATLAREFHGVGEQIEQDLLDLALIAAQ